MGIDVQNISFDIMLASYIIDKSLRLVILNQLFHCTVKVFVKDDVSIYGKGKKFKVPEDDVLNPYVITNVNLLCENQYWINN
ncbi:hypothetical protein ACVPOQ_01760 [Staphylococcus aureus]